MVRALFAAVAVLALAGNANAQSIDAATSAKLSHAIQIGKEINAHDLSAWHVTDAFLAKLPPELKQESIGFITERIDERTVRTSFLLADGDSARVLFAGSTRGETVISVKNFLPKAERPLASARQAIILKLQADVMRRFDHQLCGHPINTVILPADGNSGGFDVYALASEQETGVVQMGGHMLLHFDSNGQMTGEPIAYSNSCISIPYNGKPNEKAAAVVVTLPADRGDVPNEMHVFKSLSHGIPIYVMAADQRIWVVEGARIRLVDPESVGLK